ncbi:MAG: aspartate/glutamate racemase family protein [Bacteroidota bacterium]
MKKIGLIGGIGPESTIEYYRLIIQLFQERKSRTEYPEIVINSINMTEMLSLVFNKKYDELIRLLVKKIKQLENAGVDGVAMASNTPRIVFDEVASKVTCPMISIVQETCKAIEISELKKVGLFGTKSTMTAGFYQLTAVKRGIEVFVPESSQQDFIHEKYMNELVFKKLLPETKNQLIRIANDMITSFGVEGLILGGTELPLILHQEDFNNITVFDTTQIHVQSIVNWMVE